MEENKDASGAGSRPPQCSSAAGSEGRSAGSRGRSNRPPARVLLAEDNSEMRRLLAWSLRERGFHVTEVEDGAELDRRLALSGSAGQSERFDLVISDIRMPGKSGLEVLKSLQARGAAPAAILITAFGDEPTHREAEQMGLVLLDKPFDIQDLVKSAESALRSLLDRETTEEAHE